MIKTRERTKTIVYIGIMTAITIGLSFVRIPFFPVPFTLQTLAAMLAGIVLTRWAGVASQVFYIFLGLVGLPIFAQGGGFGYIFNPTFGYLLFLPILTLLISLLHKRLKVFGVALPAVLLLMFGTFYYIIFFHIPIQSIGKVLMSFMVLFIPAELLKSVAAFYLGKQIKKVI